MTELQDQVAEFLRQRMLFGQLAVVLDHQRTEWPAVTLPSTQSAASRRWRSVAASSVENTGDLYQHGVLSGLWPAQHRQGTSRTSTGCR